MTVKCNNNVSILKQSHPVWEHDISAVKKMIHVASLLAAVAVTQQTCEVVCTHWLPGGGGHAVRNTTKLSS